MNKLKSILPGEMSRLEARYRQYHTSQLLGFLALGLLLGLAFRHPSDFENPTLFIWVGLIFVITSLHSRRWWALGTIFVAGLLVGSVRAQVVIENYEQYDQFLGRSVTATGTLSEDPQLGISGQRKVTMSDVSIEDVKMPGQVFSTTHSRIELKRGDRVIVQAKLKPGFASYGAALQNSDVVSVERGDNVIRDVRENFAAGLRTVMMEPMASLGLGFVVGQRSALPDKLDEQLKIVGLTHIVVASGYNLTILVRFVMRLLARHSRYLAISGSLTLITLFVLFSGLSPSMNRAVIVTVLALLAWYVGRRFQSILLILFVAAVTAFVNPMYVWADLGWYLSFFAFAGILVVAPLVKAALFRGSEPNNFLQLVIETMCAEFMALPLIALTFSDFPLFGLVANVLVAPFIPLAMVFTVMAGIGAMVAGAGLGFMAVPATILIGYMVAIVEWLSGFSFAQVSVDVGLPLVVAWYGFLGILLLVIAKRYKLDYRRIDNKTVV